MALEGVVLVNAGASIVALVSLAFVDVHLAVGASKSGHALAGILANSVPASAETATGITSALIDVRVTVLSRPTF